MRNESCNVQFVVGEKPSKSSVHFSNYWKEKRQQNAQLSRQSLLCSFTPLSSLAAKYVQLNQKTLVEHIKQIQAKFNHFCNFEDGWVRKIAALLDGVSPCVRLIVLLTIPLEIKVPPRTRTTTMYMP